jgi:hypothetical protein
MKSKQGRHHTGEKQMQYTLYRQGSLFCLGMKFFPYKDALGVASVYWNPEKKVFQDSAGDCWRDYKEEDKVIADFTRQNILKEKF